MPGDRLTRAETIESLVQVREQGSRDLRSVVTRRDGGSSAAGNRAVPRQAFNLPEQTWCREQSRPRACVASNEIAKVVRLERQWRKRGVKSWCT